MLLTKISYLSIGITGWHLLKPVYYPRTHIQLVPENVELPSVGHRCLSGNGTWTFLYPTVDCIPEWKE
jgi:hypothetical protein